MKNKTLTQKTVKTIEKNVDELKKFGEDLLEKLGTLKSKYDRMDTGTKKKIAAGVAGAVALLAGVGTVRKMRKK